MRPQKWTEETMRLAIIEFRNQYGRFPSNCELDGKSLLPNHSLFGRNIGMSYRKWLSKEFGKEHGIYYKNYTVKNGSNEEVTKCFIKEYKRINPSSSAEYDAMRSKGILGWRSVAKINGVQTWKNLLTKLNLNHKPKGIQVTRNVDWFEYNGCVYVSPECIDDYEKEFGEK